MRRIGLYGGSFDPPHLAHAALGALALQNLALDELRWLPAGAPWQKADRTLADTEHRVAMLHLLLADLADPRHVLDRREIDRTGFTYTINTVREVAAEQPGAELFLVIGQDQYGRLDTWREWQELLAHVTLAVAARAGLPVAGARGLNVTPHRMVTLPLPPMDISSSDIRLLVARGMPIAGLVGDAVARYIDHHALYGAPSLPATPGP